MKKPLDTIGYNAEEFEDWWKESLKKMLKRAKSANPTPRFEPRRCRNRARANFPVDARVIWRLVVRFLVRQVKMHANRN